MELFHQTYVLGGTMCLIFYIWNLFDHFNKIKCLLKIIGTNQVVFYILCFSVFYEKGISIYDLLFAIVYSSMLLFAVYMNMCLQSASAQDFTLTPEVSSEVASPRGCR